MRVRNRLKLSKSFEHEFAPACEVTVGCENPADWYAWSVHGRTSADMHEQEVYAYCCDVCKKHAVRKWKSLLGVQCSCGYRVDGTMGKHLRFIRL